MIAYKQITGNSYTEILGVNGEACAKKLSAFRAARGLPNADLDACRNDVARSGYQWGLASGSKAPKRKPYKKLSIASVINGGLALVDVLKGDIASDEEIIRRAQICAECPMISDTQDRCTTCTGNRLAKIAKTLAVKYGRNFIQPMIIAKHLKPLRSGRISEFYCKFCGCSCLNLVLSKSKHFLKKEKTERPANCWVHKL